MLMLGTGQSELKVGKSAQSSLAPRKGMGVTRSREDLREGAKVGTNTTSMSLRPAHCCLECCKPHQNLAGHPPIQALAVTLRSRVRPC